MCLAPSCFVKTFQLTETIDEAAGLSFAVVDAGSPQSEASVRVYGDDEIAATFLERRGVGVARASVFYGTWGADRDPATNPLIATLAYPFPDLDYLCVAPGCYTLTVTVETSDLAFCTDEEGHFDRAPTAAPTATASPSRAPSGAGSRSAAVELHERRPRRSCPGDAYVIAALDGGSGTYRVNRYLDVPSGAQVNAVAMVGGVVAAVDGRLCAVGGGGSLRCLDGALGEASPDAAAGLFGSYYYAARPGAPASTGAFYWVEDALGDAAAYPGGAAYAVMTPPSTVAWNGADPQALVTSGFGAAWAFGKGAGTRAFFAENAGLGVFEVLFPLTVPETYWNFDDDEDDDVYVPVVPATSPTPTPRPTAKPADAPADLTCREDRLRGACDPPASNQSSMGLLNAYDTPGICGKRTFIYGDVWWGTICNCCTNSIINTNPTWTHYDIYTYDCDFPGRRRAGSRLDDCPAEPCEKPPPLVCPGTIEWTPHAINDGAWYENSGGPDITFALHGVGYAASTSYAVVAADVDGDGDVDLLAGSADLRDDAENLGGADLDGARRRDAGHDLRRLRRGRRRRRRPRPPQFVARGGRRRGLLVFEPAAWPSTAPASRGSEAFSVAAADLDGDDDMDIISGETAWYENDGAEGFSRRFVHATPNGAAVVVADVDGDGDLDIAAVSMGRADFDFEDRDTYECQYLTDLGQAGFAGDCTGFISWFENDCSIATLSPTAGNADGGSGVEVVWRGPSDEAGYNDGVNCQGDPPFASTPFPTLEPTDYRLSHPFPASTTSASSRDATLVFEIDGVAEGLSFTISSESDSQHLSLDGSDGTETMTINGTQKLALCADADTGEFNHAPTATPTLSLVPSYGPSSPPSYAPSPAPSTYAPSAAPVFAGALHVVGAPDAVAYDVPAGLSVADVDGAAAVHFEGEAYPLMAIFGGSRHWRTARAPDAGGVFYRATGIYGLAPTLDVASDAFAVSSALFDGAVGDVAALVEDGDDLIVDGVARLPWASAAPTRPSSRLDAAGAPEAYAVVASAVDWNGGPPGAAPLLRGAGRSGAAAGDGFACADAASNLPTTNNPTAAPSTATPTTLTPSPPPTRAPSSPPTPGQGLDIVTEVVPFDCGAHSNPIQVLKFALADTKHYVMELNLDTGEYEELYNFEVAKVNGYATVNAAAVFDAGNNSFYPFANFNDELCVFSANARTCVGDLKVSSASSGPSSATPTTTPGARLLGRSDLILRLRRALVRGVVQGNIYDWASLVEGGAEPSDDDDASGKYLIGMNPKVTKIVVVKIDEATGQAGSYAVIPVETDWNGQTPVSGWSRRLEPVQRRVHLPDRRCDRVFFTSNDAWGLFELELPFRVNADCWNSGLDNSAHGFDCDDPSDPYDLDGAVACAGCFDGSACGALGDLFPVVPRDRAPWSP
ncbi:DNA binding protein [Aureococcus anophagefferens]|nr:DNA binding protein [Aureococcus anophagefferens]